MDEKDDQTIILITGVFLLVIVILAIPLIFQNPIISIPIIISVIGLFFSKISAENARISAESAKQSSQIARRTLTATVVDSIMSNYAKPEIFYAMKNLREYKNKFGLADKLTDPKEIIEEKREKLYDYFCKLRVKDQKGELNENEQKEFEEIDYNRRLISHHFQRIYYLFNTGAMTEELAKELSTENQSQFYLEVIEPLEGGKNPNYNKDSFNQFRKFYKERLGELYHEINYDCEKIN